MSPDILLFISDQHAPQYQADGQMPVDTPNLAALREQGTAFDAAYTPCPLCVPARMAMLSGLAPHHTGIFTNNDTLPQTTPTFLHAMAAAGYETVLVGRMHFRPRPAPRLYPPCGPGFYQQRMGAPTKNAGTGFRRAYPDDGL